MRLHRCDRLEENRKTAALAALADALHQGQRGDTEKTARPRSGQHEQDTGLRSNTFATAGEAQLLGGGGLDADAADLAAKFLGDNLAHRLRMRANPGCLADDRDVGIAQRITVFTHQPGGMLQEDAAVGMAPLLLARRKMPADITQRKRSEDGIAQ